MLLVPRQLRRTGMTGNVPYYGGRFTPAQAYAASHRQATRPTQPDRQAQLEALSRLQDTGVLTAEEYHQLRARITS